MTALAQHIAEPAQKAFTSFADFCVYDAWRSSDEKKDKSFVGIRIEDNRPKIYFPMGYRAVKPSEDICKRDFYQLISVLNDKSLQSYFSEEDLKKSQLDFPFYVYLSVLQYYLDFGYFVESETIYKKGFSGKINWPRTIKRIKPQVVKDEEGHDQVVYLNLITRKTSYREDNLITLVHKFCVKESARLIGPLYGISENEVEEPELIFDYELFAEVIQDKIAATFNDKHLELFHAMLKMVRYLGNKENRGEDGSENEPLFGVNTFAPVWEAMVDKIFGKLPQGVAKDKFNPHLRWNDGCRDEKLDESEEEIVLNDPKRSTLRPDTIMVMGESVYILDSKYYKYGLTRFNSHLPGAESVCKQMAYAEYVETRLKEIPAFAGMTSGNIYNAFIMPCCADAEGASASSATFQMKRVGYIYGDWKNVKDENRPYHKIACILLDMKSVMQNYANNPTAQRELTGVTAL
ncbi:LlaJI family restriction endonuclease [Fibrobacter sp.]|uniref:LlaJI family restriction endonuclease n=1 Tax=Fibrobacter sp. TaxID=35828 RepID=UPI00388FE22E